MLGRFARERRAGRSGAALPGLLEIACVDLVGPDAEAREHRLDQVVVLARLEASLLLAAHTRTRLFHSPTATSDVASAIPASTASSGRMSPSPCPYQKIAW